MLIPIAPLRDHRDFRLLYIGQLVSLLGSMMTYVALPYQLYELTHSSFAVGCLGAVQLVPLLLFALWGGAMADAMDRRTLLLGSELVLALSSLALVFNSLASHPSPLVLFVVSAVMSALNGFHRPALDAMTPRLVDREDLRAVAALNTIRGSGAAIAGPALAGFTIAALGLPSTYALDVLSFVVSLGALSLMRSMPPAEGAGKPGWKSIGEGLRYAISRSELIGTYIVDILAMIFAMPMALFPAIAVSLGGAKAAGSLYSAMPVGALGVTLFSGWTRSVDRHGAAVVISAAIWGLAIIALGFSSGLLGAVLCLATAGAADGVSGIFRSTIWNETIPSQLRGRLAGIEMISYMTGPLLGNVRAGWVASVTSNRVSILSGGVICVASVLLCIPLLPGFWRYRAVR
jgi:MFS family permease